MVLAVGEAQGDGYGLAGGGLAGEVLGQAFGTEHVELGELLARVGQQEDGGGGEDCQEGGSQEHEIDDAVDPVLHRPPALEIELDVRQIALFRRQAPAAVDRRWHQDGIVKPIGEQDRPEADAPGQPIEEQGQGGDDGHAEPKGEGQALDAFKFAGAGEEGGDQPVAGDEEHECQPQGQAQRPEECESPGEGDQHQQKQRPDERPADIAPGGAGWLCFSEEGAVGGAHQGYAVPLL